mmetsp:Transcript_1088/g.2440  ORF Transcript_1088/g.2440 Transcript_1088/m.2440 type:complete len:286 (+) Transcript_1088:81-938(+)
MRTWAVVLPLCVAASKQATVQGVVDLESELLGTSFDNPKLVATERKWSRSFETWVDALLPKGARDEPRAPAAESFVAASLRGTRQSPDLQRYYAIRALEIITFSLVVAAIYSGIAYLFFIVKGAPRQAEDWPPGGKRDFKDGVFAYGLFSCFEDPILTLSTCFCLGCRWAYNMRMAGFLTYTAAIIFVVLYVVSYPWVLIVLDIVAIFVAVYFRQQMRQKFELEHGECTWLTDFFTYCCCMCCAVVQEARQLEGAYALPHPSIKQDAEALAKEYEPARPEQDASA